MASKKKGRLKTIVEKVENVIHSVGTGVGLVTEPVQPKSKRARKAAHKAIIEQSEQEEKQAKKAKRALRQRLVS